MIIENSPLEYRVDRSPGDRYINLRALAVVTLALVGAMAWSCAEAQGLSTDDCLCFPQTISGWCEPTPTCKAKIHLQSAITFNSPPAKILMKMSKDGGLTVDGDPVKLTDKQRKAIRDYMNRSVK